MDDPTTTVKARRAKTLQQVESTSPRVYRELIVARADADAGAVRRLLNRAEGKRAAARREGAA